MLHAGTGERHEGGEQGVCWQVPGGGWATGAGGVFAGHRSSRSIVCLRTPQDGHSELGGRQSIERLESTREGERRGVENSEGVVRESGKINTRLLKELTVGIGNEEECTQELETRRRMCRGAVYNISKTRTCS